MASSTKFYLAFSCLSLQYLAGLCQSNDNNESGTNTSSITIYLVAAVLSFCCMTGLCTACGACGIWVLKKCCGCVSKCRRRRGIVQNLRQECPRSRYTFRLYPRQENAQGVAPPAGTRRHGDCTRGITRSSKVQVLLHINHVFETLILWSYARVDHPIVNSRLYKLVTCTINSKGD